MEIIIDNREKDRIQKGKQFYENKNHNVTIKQLPVGDFVFENKIVFEIKLLPDMLQSITNGSVFDECVNQAMEYPYHYLLVVGDLVTTLNDNFRIPAIRKRWGTKDKYFKYMFSVFDGAVCSLRSFTNVIFVDTIEKGFTVMLKQSIHCLKATPHGGISRPVLNTHNPVDSLLSEVKHVSTNKSEKIRETLSINCLDDLLIKSIEDFTSVPGIGVSTAENIYNWIHKKS